MLVIVGIPDLPDAELCPFKKHKTAIRQTRLRLNHLESLSYACLPLAMSRGSFTPCYENRVPEGWKRFLVNALEQQVI
jgi:hypothetical protein